MKILNAGHKYALRTLDGYRRVVLTFVKREGVKYPGNEGHYSGTNLQEVIRCLIDRLQYLQKQDACFENIRCIEHLRECILELEVRAAKRHGRTRLSERILDPTALSPGIETLNVCKRCGHIGCREDCHK